MPTKKKSNFFTEPSRYGTYTGPRGNPDQWRAAFAESMGRTEAEEIVGEDSPWSILGVKPGSTQQEIKKAWRRFAVKWHPDMHDGDESAATMFKKGLAAYTLLNTNG